MDTTCRHVFVEGRVQGVAFRWYTAERARGLGLAGWVRNLHDGRVEVWIEGPVADVEAMVSWLHQGPPSARVRGLEVLEEPAQGCEGFDVERSAHA